MATKRLSTLSLSLHQSLNRIARRWPADKLRPNLQFSNAILGSSERLLGQIEGTESPKGQGGLVAGRKALGRPLSEKEEKLVEEMVVSLERLLDDAPNKLYPMSVKTTAPASFPKHYDRLVYGIEKAIQGQKEKWWKIFFTWRR